MKQRILAKRVLLVILGQLFISAGVALLFIANLGVDPLGVFHTGVANAFNTTFPIALFMENLIAITIIFIVDKKYLNIATVAALFVVSISNDAILSFLTMIVGVNPSMMIRVICLLLACVVLSIGLNVYVLADLGVGAMDALPEMVCDKFDLRYSRIKVISDLGFLLIGYLLGGIVGVGTIVTALVVGPIIQYIRVRIKRPIEAFIAGS